MQPERSRSTAGAQLSRSWSAARAQRERKGSAKGAQPEPSRSAARAQRERKGSAKGVQREFKGSLAGAQPERSLGCFLHPGLAWGSSAPAFLRAIRLLAIPLWGAFCIQALLGAALLQSFYGPFGYWLFHSRLLPYGLLPYRLLPCRLLPCWLLPYWLLPCGLLPYWLLPFRLTFWFSKNSLLNTTSFCRGHP